RAGISVNPPPFVGQIRRGSSAEKAGLKPGERFKELVKSDGTREALNSAGDLTRIIDESHGSPLKFLLEKDGQEREVEVVPEPRESQPGRYQLGMLISPVDVSGKSEAEVAEAIAKVEKGLVAHGVRPGSDA